MPPPSQPLLDKYQRPHKRRALCVGQIAHNHAHTDVHNYVDMLVKIMLLTLMYGLETLVFL